MPVDPNIALSIRPVQAPDPVASYGNALAITGHIQQQQLQQQQMQENALKLKQMQDDRKDDDIIKQHYLDKQGDLGAVTKSTMGLISPAKSRQLQQLSLQDQMDRAKMTNEQNTADAVAADHQAQIIDAVRAEPDPDKRQALWASGTALGMKKGWFKPGDISETVPDNNTLDFTKAAILGKKRSAEDANQAITAAGTQAQTDLHNLQLAAQTVPSDEPNFKLWFSALDPRTQSRLTASGLNIYTPTVTSQIRQTGMTVEQANDEGRKAALAGPQLAEAQGKSTQALTAGLAPILTSARTAGDYQSLIGKRQGTLNTITGQPPAAAPAPQGFTAPDGQFVKNPAAPPPSTGFTTPEGEFIQKPAAINYGPFPDLSGLDPNTPLTAEHRKAIRDASLTPEQKNTADATQENREANLGIKGIMAAIAQQRADQGGTHETGKKHDTFIAGLAGQALKESNDNGGRGIDDALANVSNTDFYEGHPIGDNRVEVLKALQAMKSQGLINQGRQAAIDKKNEPDASEIFTYLNQHPELGKDYNKAKAAVIAARGGSAAPTAAPVNTPAPQSKPVVKATLKAAVKTGASIIIRPGDGSPAMSFPDEASAAKYEALVKQAGGTSTRQ